MGNCVFRGAGELNRSSSSADTIKVMTANGGIMELFPPITAQCITSEFPNHALFTDINKDKDTDNLVISHPLLHTDELRLGHSYFLLPINKPITKPIETQTRRRHCATPYRMSLDSHSHCQQRGHQKRWSSDGLEMSSSSSTPRCNRNGGVWKVKLVISPEQLSEILAQEATTEELVESLRTVAKCGNGIGASGSITASDHWSISTGPNQFSGNSSD